MKWTQWTIGCVHRVRRSSGAHHWFTGVLPLTCFWTKGQKWSVLCLVVGLRLVRGVFTINYNMDKIYGLFYKTFSDWSNLPK